MSVAPVLVPAFALEFGLVPAFETAVGAGVAVGVGVEVWIRTSGGTIKFEVGAGAMDEEEDGTDIVVVFVAEAAKDGGRTAFTCKARSATWFDNA